MTFRPYTEQDRTTILALRESGLTWKAIAEIVGRSEGSLYSWFFRGAKVSNVSGTGDSARVAADRIRYAVRRARDLASRAKLTGGVDAPPPLSPPPAIDWEAVRAEQAAKPASERWPYPRAALVERVWPTRAPTHVNTQSSIA